MDEVKNFIRKIFPHAMVSVTEEDTVLVAENDADEIVGFAHIVDEGDKILFQGLGVIDTMRGRGIGTLLIEHVLELLSDSDQPIYLKVKVMNPAVDLYARYGFFIKKFGTTHVLVKKPNT
jgi:GNAT superfamily N-acetyltransferase